VNTLAIQQDGKIILGGTFTQLQPNGSSSPTSRANLARVNVDGTVDASYDPEPNGQVLSMALQSDGKLIIGGNFTTVQPNGTGSPVTVNHIARLNKDGTLDTSFKNLGVTGTYTSQVYGIAIQSNWQIVIGGAFVSVGTTTRNHVARLNTDGSLDTTFDPNANGIVTGVFVENSGQIIIGGAFGTV
jgi:trimeric autotransporter adhesin